MVRAPSLDASIRISIELSNIIVQAEFYLQLDDSTAIRAVCCYTQTWKSLQPYLYGAISYKRRQ